MPISFERISVGASYSRETLARLWGYSSFHALARGVVTPQGDNLIILFVTEEQQTSSEQYVDRLIGNVLYWEGPNDHFAETRMVNSAQTGDQIHLFTGRNITLTLLISVLSKSLSTLHLMINPVNLFFRF